MTISSTVLLLGFLSYCVNNRNQLIDWSGELFRHWLAFHDFYWWPRIVQIYHTWSFQYIYSDHGHGECCHESFSKFNCWMQQPKIKFSLGGLFFDAPRYGHGKHDRIIPESEDTVKPVYNDHLYSKIYYLWLFQQCVFMKTESTNLLLLTISAFWSSSRWPMAT